MGRTRWRGWRTGDDRRTSALSEDKVARLGDNSQVAAVARAADDGRGRADGDACASAAAGADEDAWRTGRQACKAEDAAVWWAPWDYSRPVLGSVSSTWFADFGTRSSPGSPSTRETELGSDVRRQRGIWWS